MTGHKQSSSYRYTVFAGALSALLIAFTAAQAVPDGASTAGQKSFAARCAACHGDHGQGSKAYPRALTGSLSTGELARFIARSMPPGPKKCPAPEAQKIAAYIYDAFYSPTAQARNRPARIELSRLTVREYRNALVDLIGSFRGDAHPSDEHGLRGEYYKKSGFDNSVLTRVDPEVHFDFGAKGADPKQDDPYQFSMRWEGSVVAPDTGDYEFIVRTDHAAQLWVNDMNAPLIDAAVKSGSGTEYRGSIFLIGGRAYPLRLEFSKGVTGVDDISKVKKKPPMPASLSLEWAPPKQSDQVIPRYCLLPAPMPESFAVSTPFPPDDRSMGYERGTSVSKAWAEATTDAALQTAGYVAAHVRDLSGVPDDAKDRIPKLRAFCRTFIERAFRRPISDATAQFYIDRQFQRAPDVETAVKRVVLLTLESPEFLYRGVSALRPDAYTLASRLSFCLWDTLPDQELLKAAAAGQLCTQEQVERQAQRMVTDSRAWAKLRAFLMQWLKVDQYPDLGKNPKLYPKFDQATASDLRTSFELFLRDVVWNDRSDYRDLMQTNKLFLNGRLAQIYGGSVPASGGFQPVLASNGERCGVLTQPYLLARFAYADSSSPIHRGVLIVRNMLGRILNPPPAAFAPLPVDSHPDLTTRERVSLQTKPAMCQGCHGIINPLGFTLERYDAIGRVRDKENGKPIDTTGDYRSRAGAVVKFASPQDLAHYLADSDDAHAAFVEKLFQFMVKQPVRAYGANVLPNLERSFADNQYSIRKLMVQIALTATIPPSGNNLTTARIDPATNTAQRR